MSVCAARERSRHSSHNSIGRWVADTSRVCKVSVSRTMTRVRWRQFHRGSESTGLVDSGSRSLMAATQVVDSFLISRSVRSAMTVTSKKLAR